MPPRHGTASSNRHYAEFDDEPVNSRHRTSKSFTAYNSQPLVGVIVLQWKAFTSRSDGMRGSTISVTTIDSGAVRYRALFISDVHLGARGCQAERLLDFLRWHEADTIYLVGDIVDGWQLRSNWYWPQSHNDVVQKLLRKARKGARIIYLPGNHDEFLRDYYGTHFGGIEVTETAIHEAANGRRYLVVHGDVFDIVVKHARWLALLGDSAYEFAIFINRYLQFDPAPARVHLLVAVAMGQAKGQKCSELHWRLRADACGGSAPP